MPVVNFKIGISGLTDLQKSISTEILERKITAGIGVVANTLHKELEKGVHDRYTIKQSITDVLIGKQADISKIGNLITASLTYAYKPLNLSEFNYTPKSIPRPPGYAEHTVQVIRGRTRVVRGKSGNGGFVPRNKANTAWRAKDGKTRMFERVGSRRLPLRVLYGPSLSQMTRNVLVNNPTEGISKVLSKLDDLLAIEVIL